MVTSILTRTPAPYRSRSQMARDSRDQEQLELMRTIRFNPGFLYEEDEASDDTTTAARK